MKPIFIYIPNITNRHRYVCAILSDYVGVPFECTSDNENISIYYTDNILEGSFTIYDYGLLIDKGLKEYQLSELRQWKDTSISFLAPEGYSLPFDIFSAMFYYLSHYDAYLPHVVDIHGRIQKEDTIAFKHHNHKIPVVEYWIHYFIDTLNLHFLWDIRISHQYSVLPTMDIDHYSLVTHRGFLGNIKGKLFARNYPIDCLQSKGWISGNDPYDIFKYLAQSIPNLQYFVLLNHGKKDSVNRINKEYIKTLFSSAGTMINNIGIHYSYYALDQNLYEAETSFFYSIFNHEAQYSRAHFLKYSLPNYFRQLIDLGISKDFSLGYYDTTGFITGMSRSYIWYDVLEENMTKLLLQPFSMMDATFLYYGVHNLKDINEDISTIKRNICKVNGVYSMILHNDIITSIKEGELLGETLFLNIFS